MSDINITYEIDDGYCGGARPQHLSIDPLDYQDLSDEEIANQLEDEIMEDFRQRSSPVYSEGTIINEIKDALKEAAKNEEAETT